MLILGSSNKKRSDIFAKRYKMLIDKGINPKEILVLVLNSYKKNKLEKKLDKIIDTPGEYLIGDDDPNGKQNEENYSPNTKQIIESIVKRSVINENSRQSASKFGIGFNIYTPYGLCYNTFTDNKEYVQKISGIKSEINLCGLEISQYIFKQSIKEADFNDYISKINLLHQLFRRYSLIVQNCLDTKEVLERSEIIKESFAIEAQRAINDYKIRTIEYNSYDYLRQMSIFEKIYKETKYFNDIKYLLIDDADELSYSMWKFIDYLMPKIKDYTITADIEGSSRCGYLCAYKSGIKNFIGKYNPQIVEIKNSTPNYTLAQQMYNNIKENKKTFIKSEYLNGKDESALNGNTGLNLEIFHKIKRLDMIEEVLNQISDLLSKGNDPCEIAIITPNVDEILIKTLNDYQRINFQILAGNQKLSDITTIKHILVLLKLANSMEIKDYELKGILSDILKIPVKKSLLLISKFKKDKKLTGYNFENKIYNDKYIKFYSVINSLIESFQSIEDQIKIIYSNIIQEFNIEIDLKKYEFLLKEARSFETAFNTKEKNIKSDFIIQIENSIISENPINATEVKKNAVIVSTPQKLIDFSIETKYQFWLDISSNEWFKEDCGTLYNAWVLSRDFTEKEFSFEDNINSTRDKSARIVRKLMTLCSKNIKFFSSFYDNSGNENYSGLNDYIEIKEKTELKDNKIIPREDQKQVLEYKEGRMGVMAVPGAGKTTILLALIMKLIKQGVNSENIFVLTYMDSAAKNFKEKLKQNLPDCYDTPNISTIHGLALRIIKENGNYSKIGTDDNIEICDDTTKERLIKELIYNLKIDEEKYENYLKCISIVKLGEKESIPKSPHKEIQDFFHFYEEYNKSLKRNNLIDYDDMLYYALQILKENPEILKHYQNICKYIIEDEAQDSSKIQQTLITLLSGKYHNIVRCGDINQAITSTFTNADLSGFKEFVNEKSKTKKVEMTSSQRCAKPIYSLANKLIENSFQNEETKNAFYKIKMEGTNKNPQNTNDPQYIILEKEDDEKSYILNKIQEIKNREPSASIAVLLRLNSQVNEYNEYFIQRGMKTSIRTDCLAQKRIYKIIHSIIKITEDPLNNKIVENLAITYNDCNIIKFKDSEIQYIKELKEPFINKDINEIEEESLMQLYWDIDYWLENSSEVIDILALKAGMYYSKTTTDKSNTYLTSTFIKRLITENENNEEVLKKLEYAAERPLNIYKFFEDENKENETDYIKIMTMHKSKGDEFDYVFIPMLNETNYPLKLKNIKIKTGSHFIQTIKNLIENSEIKSIDELKREQLEENLRLIYVGITRAKKELYITSAKTYRTRKNVIISEFFENLLNFNNNLQ